MGSSGSPDPEFFMLKIELVGSGDPTPSYFIQLDFSHFPRKL